MVTQKMSPFKLINNVLSGIVTLFLCINIFMVHAAPPGACSDGCSGSNQLSKYKYVSGNIYNYNMDNTITVQLSGNDAQETTLKLQGTAQIYAQGNCNYILKLPRMHVIGPDGKKINLGSEIIKPVKFQIINDEIRNDICTEIDDNEFSINIKRSIISLLQTGNTKSYETDIFGVCPTEFIVENQDDNVIAIGKRRNLNMCSQRESFYNGIINGIVNKNSDIKTTPLLKGDYTSNTRIKDGIIDYVQLGEEYHYIPLSSANGGIRVKTLTKFTFTTSTPFTTQFPKLKKEMQRSIIFTKPESTPQSNSQHLRNVFKATLQAFENGISNKAASKFIELSRAMRFTKKEDFIQMYQQLKSGTLGDNRVLARKIYLDALFRVGTGASVEACLTFLSKREFSDVEQKLLFLSFNMVKTMTKEAITLITRYIDEGTLTTEAYLSFGHLIYKYCKQYSCESNELKQIYEKFSNKLGGCKPGTRTQEDTNVAILKGLRNTKYLFSPALEKVIQCTTDKVSTRLRVAALQALTAGACNLKAQNAALNIMKNRNEDSEVRIEAYLLLVNCPNGNIANELKNMLDTETVYQVGSYIVSHLANLRASTDSSKDAARYHFGQIRTLNKFPNDFRRYSFNREFSYDIRSIGVGASMESDVIYSQKSFMPRSARLNMTGEVFGTSFNFLELEGRQENLDMIMEHYFGPKGLFKSSSPQELFDKLKESYKGIKEQTRQSIYGRKKRGIREDANVFAKSVTLGNDVNSDLDMDLSVKLFGNEMFFLSLGQNMPNSPREFLDKFLECIRNSINEAKNFHNTLEKHVIFLDAEIVYPTGSGLPLKLNAQGTGIFRLDSSSKIDFVKILNEPQNANFEVKFEPSFNVEVSGTLSVDGYGVSTGLFVVGSLHSSTAAQVKFGMLEDGKGVDVSLHLPKSKQELFSFDHRIVFMTQDRGSESIETPLKFSSKKKEFNECFDQLFQFIGVTFCADVSITVPSGTAAIPFPLNGNNKFIVWLEVEPEYKFHALMDNKNPKHKSLTLSFDTPSGKFERKSSLKLEAASEPNILLRATLESPIRNAGVEAGVTNSANEMSLYVKANNAAEEYLAKIGFAKSGAPPREQFRPIIIFNTPKNKDNNIMGYTVDGVITREPFGEGKKFIFNNIKITGASMEPFIINGFLTRVNSHIDTDLKITKAGQNGNIKGSFNFVANDLLFDFGMTSNFHKHANGRLMLEFKKNDDNVENNILIVYGDDLNSSENRFELRRKFNVERSPNTERIIAFSFENKLSIPVINVNLRFNGDKSEKAINGDFELIFGKAKNTAMAKINGKMNVESNLDYDIESSAGYNNNKIFLNVRRENKDEKINLTNKLWTSKGFTMTLNGDINEKLTRDNININMNSNIVLPDGKQETQYSGQGSVLVTPKVITSNGKMLNGAIEIITFNVNINRDENNRNAKSELIIKDILNAKHDFKMVNGVGEANLLIFLKKINRKIKIQNRFTIKKPDYDINIDIYYDYDNDQTKKIHYDTKTKVDMNLINTKNNFELLNEKYSLNMNYEKVGEFIDGKLLYDIDINLPNDYKFFINFNSNLQRNNNDKLTNGESLLNIGYNNNNNNIKHIIKLTTIYNKFNMNNNLYNINNIFEYNNNYNNNIIIKFNINNINEINFLLNINGNIINNKFININGRKYYDKKNFNQYNLDIDIEKLFKFIINGNYNLNKNNNELLLLTINTKYITDTITKELQLSNEFKRPSHGIIDDGKFIFKLNYNTPSTSTNNNIDLTTNYNLNKNDINIDFNLIINTKKPITGNIKFNKNNIDTTTDNIDNYDLNNNLLININDGDYKVYELSTNLLTNNLRKIINYKVLLKTPIQGFTDVDFTFNLNRELVGEYKTSILLQCDNNKYTFDNTLKLSRNNPLFSIECTYPNSKTIKILFNHNNDNNNGKKFNGKLLIENIRDFNMKINYDINISNLDNLLIKIDADSTNLKWDNIIFELHTKPGTNGKGIEFKGQTGGKNILSGYADYTIKEDNGKTIIEGQGNIKLHDKEKAASFKFIRNTFEQARDGETGVLFVLNGLIGQKNIVGELKLTDKNFFIKNTICEEKKQCINIEIQSTLQRDLINNYLKHELQISIDLREFGYAHEFGLKAATTQNGFVIDHTIDIHFYTKDKKKYQYSLYIHPEKFGIIIQLPIRIIAIEGLYNYPKSKIYGLYDTSITMYLDKMNKPNNKYIISMSSNINKNDNNDIITDIEMKFGHPTIKSYIIDIKNKFNINNYKLNGLINIDIFNDNDKKLIINYDYDNNINNINNLLFKIKLNLLSKGFNINWNFNTNTDISYERKEIIYNINIIPYNKLPSTINLIINLNKIDILIKFLNDDLIIFNGNYDINKHNSNMKGQIKLFGCNPYIIEGQTKGFNSLTFKMNKDKILNVNGQLIAGKEGTFKILSNNKEVFMGRIQFDTNNFLASEYKIQDGDFKELMKNLQESIKNDIETSNNIIKMKYDDINKLIENQIKLIRSNFNDLTLIKNDLKNEMNIIKTELMNDPTIKEYIDFLIRIQSLIIETINQMYKIINDTYKNFYDIFIKTFDTYIQIYNEKLLPLLRKFLLNINDIIKNLYNNLLNITIELFDKIIKFLKTFEDDYNKMNKIFVEQFKQVMQRFGKLCDNIRKEINDLTKLIIDYIKTMPGIDIIKEKYNDLMKNTNIKDSIQMIIQEITNSIKDTLPTKELSDFLINFTDYIEKKLNNIDNINDIEEITKLFYNLLNAIKSVYELIRKTYHTDEFGTNIFMQHANYLQQQTSTEHPFLLPFTRLFGINYIPLITNIRISLLNYIRNEPIITLRDLLNVYRPYGFRPFNFIPPYTMHGQISDGSHIFTFDNYHYTFPGGCSYILAQDNFNNNFTIIGNMNNGKLKSITLIDKGDIVEISEQGVAQLNGKNTDLPIHKNDIHCWRKYHSISLLTTYGVMIQCSVDLRVCHISVSGYYLGRLRGLLGNGNSEPYDDLLLPNNKVADNFAIFGNAYRLSKTDCKPVAYVDHTNHNHHSDVCTNLFNTESSLRYCYIFISPKNYREACDHAVDTATDKQDAACNIALTYATTCHLDNIPVNLPEQCLKCKRNDKTLDIGEKNTIITPNKQADIIFVIDISLDNIYIEMLQATINDMRKELKSRDINDVNIIIIGYNKLHKYTYLLTTNGNLDFTGKLSTIKYNGPQIPNPIKTDNDKLNDIFENAYKLREKIKEDLSISSDAKAFQQAMDYPFRATASRSIIAVRADRLKHSTNPTKSIGAAIANNRAKQMGISLHMISPIENLLTNDGQEIKTFVGFNAKTILTTDAKKKVNTQEMRNNIKYKNDLGIDLVHAVNGYAFSLEHYKQLKTQKEKKQFTTIMTGALADHIARTEITSECVCMIKRGYISEEKCITREYKLLPVVKKTPARG